MSSRDGMNYAPDMFGMKKVVKPGEFVFAASHFDHGHIYGQINGLAEAGGVLKLIYEPDAARVAQVLKAHPEARVVSSFEEILEDDQVQLVTSAAIPVKRCGIGLEVMEAGKDYLTDKSPFTTLEQLATSRVLFFNPGFAVPDSATLSNTPPASGGAFTGNYDQAGINLIGFSVLAPQVVPGGFVILEWAGSTSLYQRGFTVATTGEWYRFTASLADTARHQWTTLLGSIDDFAAARQSVSRVTLRVSRNGLPDHEFVFDDVYLAGEPEELVSDGGDTLQARWRALNAGLTYQVESAPAVTGVWSAAQSFLATGAVQSVILTNTLSPQFWRTLRP